MATLTVANLNYKLDIQNQHQIYGGGLTQNSAQKITNGGRTVTSTYIGVGAGGSGYDALTLIAPPGETVSVNLQDIIGKAINTPSSITVNP